jgi:hypothetical protein
MLAPRQGVTGSRLLQQAGGGAQNSFAGVPPAAFAIHMTCGQRAFAEAIKLLSGCH